MKYVIAVIIIFAYGICIWTGVKYGWAGGPIWFMIGLTVLLLTVYFINRK